MRKVAYEFNPEPVCLIKVPEFMRYFSGTSLGSMYKVLTVSAYRKGTDAILYLNESGYITQLAKRYDAGKVCCYFKDSDMVEALGDLTIRSVQEHRKTLETLGLIKYEKFGEGYIYQLGEHTKTSEVLWIERWVDSVTGKNSNAISITKFRIWLAEQLAPKKKQVQLLDKLRKILHQLTKNFSENGNVLTLNIDSPTQQKIQLAAAPRRKLSKKKFNKDTEGASNDEMLFSEEVNPNQEKEQVEADLLMAAKRVDYEKILSLSYRASAVGIDEGRIRGILSSVGTPRYSKYPRLSLALDMPVPEKEPERDTVVRLYAAFFFDNNNRHENLGKARVVAGRLLGAYTLDQITWTLKKILTNNKEKEIKFLVGGIHCLERLMISYNLDYKEHREFIATQKAMLAKQAEEAMKFETPKAPEKTPEPKSEEEAERIKKIASRLRRRFEEIKNKK